MRPRSPAFRCQFPPSPLCVRPSFFKFNRPGHPSLASRLFFPCSCPVYAPDLLEGLFDASKVSHVRCRSSFSGGQSRGCFWTRLYLKSLHSHHKHVVLESPGLHPPEGPRAQKGALLSPKLLWGCLAEAAQTHASHDPSKEGVESIGAFLYYSQTMLVLWDPSYVSCQDDSVLALQMHELRMKLHQPQATRLWCVFEMAAFAWAHRSVWCFSVRAYGSKYACMYAADVKRAMTEGWMGVCHGCCTDVHVC